MMNDPGQSKDMRDRLGNVEQIRDLLFGEQQRELDTRLEALENMIKEIKQEMGDRLNQLNDQFSTELRSNSYALEKKIQYVTVTHTEDFTELKQDLDRTQKNFSEQIKGLDKTLHNQTESLEQNIRHTKESLQKELHSVTGQIQTELDKYISGLQDNKISRDEFAEVLFDLCMKVKKTDFIREIEGSEVKADLLLPEQHS
jgi:sugar-specific transcriptional regulator TrmB